MPRGRKGRVAYTENDQRFTNANHINNAKRRCPRGYGITATQNGSTVTVACGCGISHWTVCTGIIDWNDALANFYDNH